MTMNFWWWWLRYTNYEAGRRHQDYPHFHQKCYIHTLSLPRISVNIPVLITLLNSWNLYEDFLKGKAKLSVWSQEDFFPLPFGTKAVILYLTDLSGLTHNCTHHTNLFAQGISKVPITKGVTQMIHKLSYFNNFSIFNLMLLPLFHRGGITARRG